MGFFSKIFGDYSEREIKKIKRRRKRMFNSILEDLVIPEAIFDALAVRMKNGEYVSLEKYIDIRIQKTIEKLLKEE